MARTLSSLMMAPRKRIAACFLLLFVAVFTFIILSTANSRLERENQMEAMIAGLQSHMGFLELQYRGRQEDIINMQNRFSADRSANVSNQQPVASDVASNTFAPEVYTLLRNMSALPIIKLAANSYAASGIHTKNLQQLRTPFVFQLLPHLMKDPLSLKPAYHMRAGRSFAEIIIGIPTVKRDKESYLIVTLTHLVKGMTEAEADSTTIVVMVGETDLEYVINTARQIENTFPKQVERGLIEVISPSASYYPDFEAIPLTLGDSRKRVKWRTKQNLDTIYLMAYAQSKGTFYLMIEDDVIAKNSFIQEIRSFTATTTLNIPNWFFIEFCQTGGIGKLFRSADLVHFITYVQLFYSNMPIDWLLESYLADRVCTIDKTSKICGEQKAKIRPKYKSSLFQHIGLYSSLKGKIQKLKNTKLGSVPTFFPHTNPPLSYARTDIEEHSEYTLKKAYEGKSYFWGMKPKKGDLVEFWFEKPTNIEKYAFRSGNVEHVGDKFYAATVEVLPQSLAPDKNFTVVGVFDEFGIAEGDLKTGPLAAIRIRVDQSSTYWAILSEIELKEAEPPASS